MTIITNGETREVRGGPVIAGGVIGFPVPEKMPEHKGAVVIEWPYSPEERLTPKAILAGAFTVVRDAETGELIPAAKITVHAEVPGMITADIGVFLDAGGEIIHDPWAVATQAVGPPATFTFRVCGMRNGSSAP